MPGLLGSGLVGQPVTEISLVLPPGGYRSSSCHFLGEFLLDFIDFLERERAYPCSVLLLPLPGAGSGLLPLAAGAAGGLCLLLAVEYIG